MRRKSKKIAAPKRAGFVCKRFIVGKWIALLVSGFMAISAGKVPETILMGYILFFRRMCLQLRRIRMTSLVERASPYRDALRCISRHSGNC